MIHIIIWQWMKTLKLRIKREIDPVVRFYTWNPATLSVGYFQRLKKEIDIDKVNEKGFGLVRRQTGGRGFFMIKN